MSESPNNKMVPARQVHMRDGSGRRGAAASRGNASSGRVAGNSGAAARSARAARSGERGAARSGEKASGEKKASIKVDPAAAAQAVGGFVMKFRVALLVVVAVVVVLAALYGPAQTYWQAWRTNTQLQSSYDSLTQSNEDLEDDLERLQSREGIEDEARKKGYVYEGETNVNVEGLPDDSSSSDSSSQEDPWYITLGDYIFGYSAS